MLYEGGMWHRSTKGVPRENSGFLESGIGTLRALSLLFGVPAWFSTVSPQPLLVCLGLRGEKR